MLFRSMGFRMVSLEGGKAVLSANGKAPHILLTERKGALPKPANSTGLYHVAIRLPSRMELSKLLRRMIVLKRYPFTGFSDHAVSEAVYLNDPDGNGLELYQDRPREVWPRENGYIMMTTKALDMEGLLAEALESGVVVDGAVATSDTQAQALWSLRENISEAQKREGFSIKHDISVPVSAIPNFLETADAALAQAYPCIRVVAFGHVGDGNLHYNVSPPKGTRGEDFEVIEGAVNRITHDAVHAFNGSVSAEHGLGVLRRGEAARYKSAVELKLMHAIKQALDPQGIMNPGKALGDFA